MLSVIAIWIYMFLTTFLVGYGLLSVLTRGVPYRIKHADTYLICGLVMVTVYAQFFSLFGRVGMAANLFLCLAAVLAAWFGRRELGNMLRGLWSDIRADRSGKRGKAFAGMFLFLLFAYGTSRGVIHYDTSLYHAQSIRWLEEYGAVRGLGNLHCRLAYNSASFALSALYSMAFLGGQSYHCAAGWLAYLLAAVCLELLDGMRRGRLRVGDFARVMCVYYLVNIFDEMISPASDYFMVLTAFYIVIRWLDLLEEEVGEIFPFAMLCVLGVFLLTVKLSAALILLLTLWPACRLLKEKRTGETLLYLALGFVTALPYFIRNVLISGWLVYPFTQIDLFDVTWKVPKGLADYDAKEIRVYGRGYTDVLQFDLPVTRWLPDWFRALAGSEKLFVALAAVSMCTLVLYVVGALLGLWRKSFRYLSVQIAVSASFLFWLCTSPLMRYGCVWVYLTPAVVLGGIRDAARQAWESGGANRDRARRRSAADPALTAAVVLFLLYKGFALCREAAVSYVNDYWIAQKDYDNYATVPYEINGATFYYPETGDQVGYESFPSSPTRAQICLLGRDIADGFRAAALGEK